MTSMGYSHDYMILTVDGVEKLRGKVSTPSEIAKLLKIAFCC
jgi:hypothetical protein